MFDKIKAVITDNATSIVKAIRQLGTTHLGCTTHTIHLVQLLELQESTLKLAKSLENDPDHTARANGFSLNEKILSDEE
ncbi:9673_t:CDS:2 [Cetraspora pellucida]|uniref:9673_t:CDS:1 n=1 Tax=Cetraspora pellucida TaxID=1433469 RepID=A0A9N9HWN8_9GLOM|nr:9673_t:CDS:2 [Cetraspora pellucida]